ncbi:hypothetical protein V8E53_008762 [Lactarius tabidus]
MFTCLNGNVRRTRSDHTYRDDGDDRRYSGTGQTRHCEGKAYIRRVSSYVPPAGDPTGKFQDDLTNVKIGNWPLEQNIETITAVKVYTAEVITRIDVTYKLKNSPTPVTVSHGGNTGKETLSIEASATEIFLGLFFRVLTKESPFGAKSLLAVTFVVADTSGDAITTKIYTTSGTYKGDTNLVELNVGLAGLTSFTATPKGLNTSYLQAVGISVNLGPDSS